MKSYGRAPTFLAMTGYEQVRSVAAELAGDHEAAGPVELALPDTGVCGSAGLFDDPDGASGGACCAPASQVLQIGLAPPPAEPPVAQTPVAGLPPLAGPAAGDPPRARRRALAALCVTDRD